MGLCHFKSDRTCANDQQVTRAVFLLKQRLVRHVGNLVEPRYRRNKSRGSGRDNKAARRNLCAVHLHGIGTGKTGETLYDLHTKALETLYRIMRRDPGNRGGDMLHCAGEVGRNRGCPPHFHGFGLRQQGFRGHTAIIQAVSAHLVPFYQHHARAHLDSPRCH